MVTRTRVGGRLECSDSGSPSKGRSRPWILFQKPSSSVSSSSSSSASSAASWVRSNIQQWTTTIRHFQDAGIRRRASHVTTVPDSETTRYSDPHNLRRAPSAADRTDAVLHTQISYGYATGQYLLAFEISRLHVIMVLTTIGGTRKE